MRLSEKLGALCATVVLVPMIVASIIVVMKVSSVLQDRAAAQFRTNSRTALELYEKRLAELRSVAQKLASDFAGKIIVSSEDPESNRAAARAQIQDLLPSVQKDFSLDFVVVADSTGRVIIRHNDQPAPNETLLGGEKNPVAEKVIDDARNQRNMPAASGVIERNERLARLNLDLRSKVERVDGTLVEDALVIEAAAPMFREGKFYGLVLTGQLVNNSFSPRAGENPLQTPLQFEARNVLYQNEDAGAVIALGDTIIASSMPANGSSSDASKRVALVGVRRDPSQEEQVIEHTGRSYAVRWQSVKAIDGSEVGAIGVAVPSARLTESAGAARTTMIVIAIIASLVAGAVGFLFGRNLGSRIESLSEAAERMSVGELSREVEDPALTNSTGFLSQDEITRLARKMDEMRDSFRQAIERMRRR
jgi:HAMP domain-containing protein